MQLTVTGRHFEITDALRQHVDGKMSKINHYIENVTDVHVVLSVEKHRHIAEVTFQANGSTIRGVEEQHDMYLAFDAVMEKIERQIKKLKEKGSRKGRAGSKEIVLAENEDESDERPE